MDMILTNWEKNKLMVQLRRPQPLIALQLSALSILPDNPQGILLEDKDTVQVLLTYKPPESECHMT